MLVVEFLRRKWARELDYRLIKEVWAFRDNRIAVRFVYEWHDDAGSWYRARGNEQWEFDEAGLMPYIPHIGTQFGANFRRYSAGRYAWCGTPRRLST